ncbi:MAG: hypothetical protein KFW07_00795, partial [Mycoplasmataceae bacterium]|nr:hypothetical protein [Mycoplasmataceae bacterium]
KESLIKNKTASEAKVAIDNDSSQLDNYYSKIELSKGFTYSYKSSEVVTTTLKVIVTIKESSTNKTIDAIVNITGFSSPSNIEFDKGGQTLEGLNVSKYLILVNSLNLDKSTTISSLTNTSLTDKLKLKPEFSNLSLVILEQSSERVGSLYLRLSGKYNNIEQNGEIIINNFFTFDKAENYNTENLYINKSLYFENLQTASQVNSWTEADWIKYIEKLNIWSSNDSSSKFTINVFDMIKHNRIESLVFDQNNKTFKSSLSFKKYDLATNAWIIDGNKKNLTFKINNDIFEKFIPNQVDAKTYILNNLILTNENTWKQQYPSFYFREFHGGLSRMDQYFAFPNGMIDTYFPTQEPLYIETTNINLTDDFAGTFTLNIKLVDPQNEFDSTFIREFQLTGLKTIENVFSSNVDKEIVGNFDQKELRRIARDIKIDILKAMAIKETKSIPNLRYFNSLFEYILLVVYEDKVDPNFLDTLGNLYSRGIKFTLLGQELRDSFGRTGLFNLKAGTPFGIKYIGIDYLSTDKITTVKRVSNEIWDVRTEFKYTIRLFDKEIERVGVLISTMSEADWL